MHGGTELAIEAAHQLCRLRHRGRTACEHAAHDGIALLGARHRLDDVACKGGVQIAEKADGATVGLDAREYPRHLRFRNFLRRHGLAVLVDRLEVAAVNADAIGLLAL